MNIETNDLQTLLDGYGRDAEGGGYSCLFCGESFRPGEVYPMDGRFFEAQAAAAWHVGHAHGSRLDVLLDSDSKYLGLTENQKSLMRLLAQGKNDAEIAAETGTARATVRRQRFAFREKAKQARMYLAVYQLAHAMPTPAGDALVPVHEGAPMVDERFVMTQAEEDRYVKNAFSSLQPLSLRALPVKEKKKIAVLNRISRQFEAGRSYTEEAVNSILKAIQPDDYVTLRRYLIEYGYMDREKDGSRYWMR